MLLHCRRPRMPPHRYQSGVSAVSALSKVIGCCKRCGVLIMSGEEFVQYTFESNVVPNVFDFLYCEFGFFCCSQIVIKP